MTEPISSLPNKNTPVEEPRILVSADSTHKAENIDFQVDDDTKENAPPQKKRISATMAEFPELEALAREVAGYNDSEENVPIKEESDDKPDSHLWSLPPKLREKVVAKTTIKLYTADGFLTLNGFLGDFTLNDEGTGRYRFLLTKEIYRELLKVFFTHSTFEVRDAKSFYKAAAKKAVAMAILKKFNGNNKTRTPVRGIREKKVHDKYEEVGLRISEINIQVIKGQRNVLKSPWVHLGIAGKTIPSWKISSLTTEPTGEDGFVWVEVTL